MKRVTGAGREVPRDRAAALPGGGVLLALAQRGQVRSARVPETGDVPGRGSVFDILSHPDFRFCR